MSEEVLINSSPALSARQVGHTFGLSGASQVRIHGVLVDLQENATRNIEAARKQSAELAVRAAKLENAVREYEVRVRQRFL